MISVSSLGSGDQRSNSTCNIEIVYINTFTASLAMLTPGTPLPHIPS